MHQDRLKTLGEKRKNRLAILKILNQEKPESPFTLIYDNVNTTARSLLNQFYHRSLAKGNNTIYVAWETVPSHFADCHVLHPRELSAEQLISAITVCMTGDAHNIIIFDNMHDLSHLNVTLLVSQILVGSRHSVSIVGVCHRSVPAASDAATPYQAGFITQLSYMATCIVSLRSLQQALAEKAAKDRCLEAPSFGLLEEAEGVVAGLGLGETLVLDVEFRRKSGTKSLESFLLRPLAADGATLRRSKVRSGVLGDEFVSFLEEHPAYVAGVGERSGGEVPESSFNLELTDAQRRARENVVLPYHDAQTGAGGEGGRILYEMTAEDDFDEEEDEI